MLGTLAEHWLCENMVLIAKFKKLRREIIRKARAERQTSKEEAA